jgi:photosystem II stability/assembly factor-like uncharacterized protein
MKKVFYISILLLTSSSLFAQWVQTSGPSGGGVSDFAFVGGKILAATFDLGNGVFASTDSGTTWHESGLQNIMLTKIAANGNTVLAASTQNTYNETDNIYRSNDGGVSWDNIFHVQNINGIRSICHFQNQWFFSAQGNGGGLFVSSDDGIHWEMTTPANFNFTNPVVLVSSENTIIAGTDIAGVPTVYFSTDGQTWSNNGSVLLKQISCACISDNMFWLAGTGGVASLSTNGGSWQNPKDTGFDNIGIEGIISLSAHGNNLVAVTAINSMYYSWDGGDSWTKIVGNGLPLNASNFFSVYFWNNNYFLGSSSGIMRSQNLGTSWQYSSAGLRATLISQLASNSGEIFAATERGISYTSDGGSSWHDPQSLADLNDVPIQGFLSGGNKFYAFGAGLYSWNSSAWNTIDTNSVTALCQTSSGRLIASRESNDPISGTGGLYFSDNGGTAWDSLLTFTNSFDSEFYFMPQCISAHGSTIVAIQKIISFAAFTSSFLVYRSSDNGVTWQTSAFVNSPSLIIYADGSFYMGTSEDGLFRSDDDGITWIPIGFNSKSGITSFMKIGSSLFASVTGNGNISDGLYTFSNDGAGWKYANNGTYNIMGPIATDGTYLYSGGPSVWKRRLNDLGVIDSKTISYNTSLECYPNPSGNIIHFHTNSTDPLHGMLHIINENGFILIRQEINFASKAGDAALSLEGIAEGAYYARILDKSGNEIAGTRFILNRK